MYTKGELVTAQGKFNLLKNFAKYTACLAEGADFHLRLKKAGPNESSKQRLSSALRLLPSTAKIYESPTSTTYVVKRGRSSSHGGAVIRRGSEKSEPRQQTWQQGKVKGALAYLRRERAGESAIHLPALDYNCGKHIPRRFTPRAEDYSEKATGRVSRKVIPRAGDHPEEPGRWRFTPARNLKTEPDSRNAIPGAGSQPE